MVYKGRVFNRENVYVCGDYIDGDIYPVFQPAGKRRRKCKPTSEIQMRLNQKNAEKRLTRLVHANFTDRDIALHLTYDAGNLPEDEKAAARDLTNFIRRLKRRYKKAGVELKYISCTEIGEKKGRVHHHLIATGGVDRDEMERLWGKGYANSKRLQFGDDGVTGLTRYVVKDRHFYKRWNQSRNLTIPEAAQYDGQLNMNDIEEMIEAIDDKTAHRIFEERYPDFELVEVGWYKNNINKGAYIHFEMRRRKNDGRKRQTHNCGRL